MYHFYVEEGKKLLDFKPKVEHYANALARRTFRVREMISEIDTFGNFEKEHPDEFAKHLYLYMKFTEKGFDFSRKYTEVEITSWFQLIEYINQMIGCITPAQFMQIFPVRKEYDGEKYGIKDYWTTMQKIAEIGLHTPIGEDASYFLFDYCNDDVDRYMLSWMEIVNRMHQMQGEKDIMLEFFEEQGIPFKTYHVEEGYLVDDETGEAVAPAQLKEKPMRRFFSV